MRNNFYKVLRIIVLVLTIISLVFTISYKISKAASSDTSDTYYPFASDQPLRVAPDMGQAVLDQASLEDMISDLNSGSYDGYNYAANAGFNDVNLVLFREYNASGNYISCYAFKDGYISDFQFPSTYPLEDITSSSLFCNFRSLNNYLLRFDYDFDTSSITYVTSTTGNSTMTFWPLNNNLSWVQNLTPGALVNVYALIPEKSITNYPVYIRDGELSYNGSVRFSTNYSSGGESPDQDIIDNIDDNDLPQIDDDDPQDPSSVSAWLKKILAGIKLFNNNQNGIGKTIIDLLRDIKDELANNPLKELADDYKAAKNTTPADFVNAYNNTQFAGAVNDLRGDANMFMMLFDVSPALIAPRFEIPLNNTLLYSDQYPSIIIDFAIYDNWRDKVNLVLCAIIAISFIYNFLRSLPDILGGDSGDESS